MLPVLHAHHRLHGVMTPENATTWLAASNSSAERFKSNTPPRPRFSRADSAASGRGRGPQEVLEFWKTDASVSGVMAAPTPEGVPETQDGKRRQFGNRFLSDPARVFHYNAW